MSRTVAGDLETRDAHDERWARLMREELGYRRWLVSWSRIDADTWQARVSCDQWSETIEATARTRCLAIGKGSRELEALLKKLNEPRPVYQD